MRCVDSLLETGTHRGTLCVASSSDHPHHGGRGHRTPGAWSRNCLQVTMHSDAPYRLPPLHGRPAPLLTHWLRERPAPLTTIHAGMSRPLNRRCRIRCEAMPKRLVGHIHSQLRMDVSSACFLGAPETTPAVTPACPSEWCVTGGPQGHCPVIHGTTPAPPPPSREPGKSLCF